jgi:hypothetical protein
MLKSVIGSIITVERIFSGGRDCYGNPSPVLSWGSMYLVIIPEEASSVPVSAGHTN